jgi:CRP/FNR family transcriptional regulator, anaerobic regulatory protein
MTVSPVNRFLQAAEPLQTFDENEKAFFQQELTLKTFKAGELLVEENQHCRHLTFILTGYFRKYHIDANGNEVTSEFNSPGSFSAAYYSFYTEQASFESIEAITAAEVLQLSFSSLQTLYSNSFNMNVFGRKVLERACLLREVWLKKKVSLQGTERYAWFVKEYKEIAKIAQLQHIASFLGLKPETLSRIRRKRIS